MANVLTFNQIIDVLKDIATRHYQINTFVLGRDFDVDNQITDNIYPVMQVFVESAAMPQNGIMQYQTLQVVLNVKIIDLETDDESNEQYVHSDTLQISQDIINEINQHPYFMDANLSILGDIQLTALEKYEDDITAGWSFGLTLQLINNNSFCGLPMAPITSEVFFGPVSTGYTQSVTYLTCDTLTGCSSFISYIAQEIAPAFTGATYSAGTLTFTSVDGNQVEITGISSTNTFVTGGTYSNGTTTLIRNDGAVVTISGYYTGATEVEYWTSGSTGNFSLKVINDSLLDATGSYALAEGYGTLASGDVSHAEGDSTIASGLGSHAEGLGTLASGDRSHAQGSNTLASGYGSHAEGEQTYATGGASHAEGLDSRASGDVSHAEGEGTTASGYASHTEGNYTTASGDYSHTEGTFSLASGSISHAEGRQTTASGFASHAEGSFSTASGGYSHAGGLSSTASGLGSFVHGTNSLASGNNTIVLGASITGNSANTTYIDYLNIKSIHSGTTISNLGIDINGNVVTGTTGGATFTGGTVTGATNFTNGLTANTISATTYLGLPTDITVTGGTLSAGTAIFRNNTGGTFSITGFNSTIDTFVTGFTYGNNTFTIRNSTGGTLTALNNTMTGLTINGSLSATTISATTYLNIPSVFGTGVNNNGTIVSGVTGYIVMTHSGLITGWELIGATTGSVVFDIWKTSANALPTVANSITGTNKPQISNGFYSGSTNLNTWSGLSYSSGDKVGFKIDSVTGFTQITLSVKSIKS